ncbi:MAG: ABC transporter permease [Sphingomonas fennica]
MRVAFALARRDARSGGRGLLLLVLCLFLGTAALAGIGSLSSAIVTALDTRGRQMLGGDLEMRVSQRRATVEEDAAFAAIGSTSTIVGLRAMARAGGAPPTLVALKGVDARWPLVGRLRLADGALADRPRGRQVAVAPALADRLSVRVGQSLSIGAARLRIIGLIADEPDAGGEGFALGPRALVDMDGLEATGLIQPGSLYDSRTRLLLPRPAAAEGVGAALVRRWPSAGWTARTPTDAARGLRQGIERLGQFLLLVGLAALAIAGIGVAGGVSAYLAGRRRAIATLKVLGATSGRIAAIFAIQIGAVGGLGIAAGLAIGAALPAIVGRVAGAALPVPLAPGLHPRPLIVAAALAALVTALSALPALAAARAVPAAGLLRGALMPPARPGRGTLLAMALLAAAIGALAILSATDRLLAAGFTGGVALTAGGLWLLGRAIRAGLARLPRARSPLVRLAVANLHRPGAGTDRLVVALGLGFALFVALSVIDTSLSRAMTEAAPARAPRFFAIDLQPGDAAAFTRAVRHAAPSATIEQTPSLRGQIVALNGRRLSAADAEGEGRWVLRGDRTITWAATLPPRNAIAAGRWWPADYRGPPLVSIEDRAAKALGLRVGDTITVAVLGVDVVARIAALRTIDWSGLGLNFAIVFSPGLIEEAPHGLLAAVYAPPARDGAVARAVAEALPSVSLIRTGDVIGRLTEILAQVGWAIRAAAGVTVAAGIAVLVGAVAATARTRLGDAVILSLLGARRRQLLAVQGIEYGILSAILAAVALLVGGGAGWAVTAWVLALPFAPDPVNIALVLLAAAGATIALGLLGTLSVLKVRPAEALRRV